MLIEVAFITVTQSCPMFTLYPYTDRYESVHPFSPMWVLPKGESGDEAQKQRGY